MPLSTCMFRNNPLLALNIESYQTTKKCTPLALWNCATATTQRTLTRTQRHMNKMYDSCSSKVDSEMLDVSLQKPFNN